MVIDHPNLIQIYKFGLMGHSLSPLHALGKFPEINRKLFASSCFQNFQRFPLMVNWVEMVVLDSNNKKEAMCLRLGFG